MTEMYSQRQQNIQCGHIFRNFEGENHFIYFILS